jgi:hypothetical protein
MEQEESATTSHGYWFGTLMNENEWLAGYGRSFA